MNIIAIHLDDCDADDIDSRSMPYLTSDPQGAWVKFPNCIISTPWCGPARAAAFTGQRGDHNGQIDNAWPVAYDITSTILKWINDASGWSSAFYGKVTNGWSAPTGGIPSYNLGCDDVFANGSNVHSGWTAYREDGSTDTDDTTDADYFTDRTASELVTWLTSVSGSFFAMWAPPTPHTPFEPAPRHAATDCGGSTSADDPVGWNVQITNPPAYMVLNAMDSTQQAQQRVDRANMRRMLRSVDEALEDIIDVLVSRSLLSSTAIFFLNDNGVCRGRSRVYGGGVKRRPYRWCTDSLLRVRWPGQVNRVEERLVSTTDLTATWALMSGATPVVEGDGIDMRPLLDLTADASWRSSVEAVHLGVGGTDNVTTWWAVVWQSANGKRRWRYIENDTAEIELYDDINDPGNLVNVASSNPTITAFLSARLKFLKASSLGQRV